MNAKIKARHQKLVRKVEQLTTDVTNPGHKIQVVGVRMDWSKSKPVPLRRGRSLDS